MPPAWRTVLELLGLRTAPWRQPEPRLDGWIEPRPPQAAGLIIEAEEFIATVRDGRPTTTNGAELAGRLGEAARDLANDERTRYSQQVRWLHLLAAQVALLSFKPGSAELLAYETAIFADLPGNYRRTLAAEYRALKTALTDKTPAGRSR